MRPSTLYLLLRMQHSNPYTPFATQLVQHTTYK